MIAPWLLQVLAERSILNLEHHDGRVLMAEAITDAIPKALIVAAIRESASAVLRTRAINDAGGVLASEIARNAAQTVLLMLQVGEE